jgi:hypothetical protein
MHGQSGHLVIGTTSYRGHVWGEAEVELDISHRPALPCFVIGEEEEWGGGKEWGVGLPRPPILYMDNAELWVLHKTLMTSFNLSLAFKG